MHLAVTFDEEVGCRGAPLLISDLAASGMKPSAAIVGEPTGMAIVTAHKGMHEFTTTITGLPAHASVPESGVNAVHLGARYVSNLLGLASQLADFASSSSPYDPPHTTISVGTISGGLARNVVAGECVIEWEMRPVSNRDAEHVIDEVRAMEARLLEEMKPISPEASITTVTEGAVSGLEEVEESYATRLLSDLVESSETEVMSFGTEAGLYQAAGIPAVVCGPGDIEIAHRPDEYIELDQLATCLTFMDKLMGKLIEE
jgi:acetylornithine deacetylase